MYRFVTEEKIKKLNKYVSEYKPESIFTFDGYCCRFEEQLADYEGYKHCVLTTNGSSANLLVAFALKELLLDMDSCPISFPALTWSTNIAPFLQAGFKCEVYDVSMDDLSIDGGFMSNRNVTCVTEVLGLIPDYNLFDNRQLIIDGCESFGSSMKMHDYTKSNVLALTRSFYISHQFSTIEGGAILTNNDDFYDILLSLREHGWTRNKCEGLVDPIRAFEKNFEFEYLGFNTRPIDMIGYLGVAQIEDFQKEIYECITRKKYERLVNVVSEFEFCETIRIPDYMTTFSPLAFPIIFNFKRGRNNAINKFRSVIDCRPLIAGNILHHNFLNCQEKVKKVGSFDNADRIHDCGMYIPIETKPEVLYEILKEIEE